MPLALRTDAIIAAPPNVANGCEKSILGWCPIFEPSKTHSAGDYLQNRYNIVRPKLNHQLGQARPDQTRPERTTYIAVLWETTLSSGWQRLKPWLIVLKVELAGRAVVWRRMCIRVLVGNVRQDGLCGPLSMRLSSHLIQGLPVRAAVAVCCGIKFAVSMDVQLLARNLIKERCVIPFHGC